LHFKIIQKISKQRGENYSLKTEEKLSSKTEERISSSAI